MDPHTTRILCKKQKKKVLLMSQTIDNTQDSSLSRDCLMLEISLSIHPVFSNRLIFDDVKMCHYAEAVYVMSHHAKRAITQQNSTLMPNLYNPVHN